MPREKLNFDRLMDALNTPENKGALLDNCMSLDQAVIKQIPLRYRIIALGFVRGMDLDELQQKLMDNGCAALYARSVWEATLIFAFSHKLGYGDWKKLCAECRDILRANENVPYFNEPRITFSELERYVTENSETSGSEMCTRMYTQYIDTELTKAERGSGALRTVLLENSVAFSPVREKTRYYFCKYLYYYLNGRLLSYFDMLREKRDAGAALAELLPFKAVTKLRRNKTMPESEKFELLRGSAISCGELFDSFNMFFFGYVSLNWIDVLLETFDDAGNIPAGTCHALAEAVRRSSDELKNVKDDTRVIRAYIASAEKDADNDDGKGYGRNRSGEHALFGYIKGTADIGRTALMCFMLFFSSGKGVPEQEKISEERMSEILINCGYAPLRPDDSDLDWFVSEFLISDDPAGLLQDIITESAVRYRQNSFLYRVYCGAVSNSGELRELME